MRVPHQKEPLVLRQALDVERAIRMLGGMGAPIAEGAGIAGIAQRSCSTALWPSGIQWMVPA